jgi:hypothetical protein
MDSKEDGGLLQEWLDRGEKILIEFIVIVHHQLGVYLTD